MMEIKKANKSHVSGIVKVCTEANWATYRSIYKKEYIESIIATYYNDERILEEVSSSSKDWGGYFVALDQDEVVGVAGGGMISDLDAEVYVLYLDPNRRNEGIGSLLLNAVTEQQEEYGARIQWVSVQKGNKKAIPFYEAKGFKVVTEEESDGYQSLRYSRQI
ncbi:GNAT family N-acetyltransferase [Ornithinibacillus sp. BX22]|uniref:GNAT family N-acetyltransferase n=1 Tax=Ornithinibacillus hominis TaxID=2763055 RepID=A0A923L6I9_9BACI|nr:GNAT family N-acetyltransferase [Ornithinibacillus hominis]MBC5637285.1 GNAT family N-acetyltransferase [Ornithinibacillus hominis]